MKDSNEGYSDEIYVEFFVGAVEIDGRSLGDSEGYFEGLLDE